MRYGSWHIILTGRRHCQMVNGVRISNYFWRDRHSKIVMWHIYFSSHAPSRLDCLADAFGLVGQTNLWQSFSRRLARLLLVCVMCIHIFFFCQSTLKIYFSDSKIFRSKFWEKYENNPTHNIMVSFLLYFTDTHCSAIVKPSYN